MNEEILKLAEDCHITVLEGSCYAEPDELEAFYKAAYNRAVLDAANAMREYPEAVKNIRQLELK